MGAVKGDGASTGAYEKPVIIPEKPAVVTPFPQTKYSDNSGRFLINGSGLEMAKHFESFFPKAYVDPVGVVTIAYGRIIYPNGKKVKMGDTCTQSEADAWLLEDLYGEGAKYVRSMLTNEDELNENEFSACVDFTFNRGAGRFRDYIAPYLNKGDKKGAMKSLLTVNWAGSQRKYLLGLDRRRWAEKYLFEGKDWSPFKSISWFKAFKAKGYK
jgi:lysozyme